MAGWTALPGEVSHHSIMEAPPREHTVAPEVAGDGSAYHRRAVAMSAICLCFPLCFIYFFGFVQYKCSLKFPSRKTAPKTYVPVKIHIAVQDSRPQVMRLVFTAPRRASGTLSVFKGGREGIRTRQFRSWTRLQASAGENRRTMSLLR